MQIPIVLTAFGTTTRAFKTYEFMDELIRKEFVGCEIHWAFSSRIVKDRLAQKKGFEVRHPHKVLEMLHEKGHVWAVVQSLHLLCGHEFYRLLEEVKPLPVRTSIGLPLLSSYEDYRQLSRALRCDTFPQEEALVLVGHGTDHPAWSTYPALEHVLRQECRSGIYVGAVEGHPSQEQVVKEVTAAGFRKVRLIPLMLVAGVHFYEDLCEGEESWLAAFTEAGCKVQVEAQGIGAREEVIRIFINHIVDALDVIPGSDSHRAKGVTAWTESALAPPSLEPKFGHRT